MICGRYLSRLKENPPTEAPVPILFGTLDVTYQGMNHPEISRQMLAGISLILYVILLWFCFVLSRKFFGRGERSGKFRQYGISIIAHGQADFLYDFARAFL